LKVKIPFYERFRQPMLDGTKTWTSRTRWYGDVGDTFDVFGATFKITKRMKKSLVCVAGHWEEEGCVSEHDFKEVWRKIHRVKGYYPAWVVKVHVFERVEEDT